MAGIMGSRSFDTYRKEMAQVVSENKHRQLLDIDPDYREAWEKFCKAQADKEAFAVRQMYKKKMAAIANKYEFDLKFTKSKANRDKLIISCLPMVVSLAKRFIGKAKSGVYMDDLIQAGNLGLIMAADRYIKTPVPVGKKEAKFSTMAYMWIFKYIQEEAYRHATPFGGESARNAYLAANLTQTLEQRAKKDGDEFTNDTWDDASMNKLLDLKEFAIVSDEVRAFREQSKKLFSVLSKEEKKILFMAYGISTPQNTIYSQREIAKMLGMSEATVSRSIAASLRKLTYSARGNVSGVDLITGLAQLHGVDLSQLPEWSMSDTY